MFMLNAFVLSATIIGLVTCQSAGQGQYYTPPAPPPTATLGQAYNVSPQQLSQPIRVYGSAAPSTGYTPAQQYAAQPQAQISQAVASQLAGLQGGHSAAAAAPAASVPSNYGWQVQHQTLQPQPAPASAAAYAGAGAPATISTAPAAATAAAAASPLHRPASVHYAQIGENLAGDYKFGYQTGDGNSFREESRLPDGTVQGQYGFVDADGKQRVVKYQAGVGGFQVLGGGSAAAAAAPASLHSAPVARSAGAAAPPVTVPAIPQWAQGHIGGPIPAAPQPQPQPAVHQAAALSQYSSPSAIPQQHTTTLQLSSAGARFASSPAISQYTQGGAQYSSLGGATSSQYSSPAIPQQHTTTLQLGPQGAQLASLGGATSSQYSSPATPQQHTTTLQLGSQGAQFAQSAAGHANTLTIRPIAAIAVRAGSSGGAQYGQAATPAQAWGSHLG